MGSSHLCRFVSRFAPRRTNANTLELTLADPISLVSLSTVQSSCPRSGSHGAIFSHILGFRKDGNRDRIMAADWVFEVSDVHTCVLYGNCSRLKSRKVEVEFHGITNVRFPDILNFCQKCGQMAWSGPTGPKYDFFSKEHINAKPFPLCVLHLA